MKKVAPGKLNSSTAMNSSWRRIWNKKGREYKEASSLPDLLRLNGYDTSISSLNESDWLEYVDVVTGKFSLGKEDRVVEVGCGAGAFLFCLDRDYKIFGLDFSEELVQIAKKTMPYGTFSVDEAKKLPYPDETFKLSISSGVFLYFPDLDYAEEALLEMIRVTEKGGGIAVLDVNDTDKKEAYFKHRIEVLGEKKFHEYYDDSPHLFITKKWFVDLAEKYRLKIEIQEQFLKGYGNSAFRFNVFMFK